jgi:peptidyl-tRNA hydrolase, PTH1 family
MKLVIGLGNIGDKYIKTRHNLGFMAIDRLAQAFGSTPESFSKHSKASALTLDLQSTHNAILIKPTTMMNLSGQAIEELARFYKVDSKNVYLIYDDVDLPFGQLRVRFGGGSAGHNGIKSIIEHIGHDFWRFRMGIGNQYLADTPTDKFVLDDFNKVEQARLPDLIDQTVDQIEASLLSGNDEGQTQVRGEN